MIQKVLDRGNIGLSNAILIRIRYYILKKLESKYLKNVFF
jgi:hypothetical protein